MKKIENLLVFENHGHAAGASLKHSHTQPITITIVSKQIEDELMV